MACAVSQPVCRGLTGELVNSKRFHLEQGLGISLAQLYRLCEKAMLIAALLPTFLEPGRLAGGQSSYLRLA